MQVNGIIILSLCAFFWSTGGILLKIVDWNPIAICGIRSFIAFVAIIIITRKLPSLLIKDENGKTELKQSFYLWTGGICYGLTMLLFVIANKRTTAANAILLQYTNPVYIILFSPILLGEKNRLSDYLSAIGIMFGMFLFFYDGIGTGSQSGNILAALSGLAFAFTTMLMRKVKGSSSLDSFMIAHITMMLASIPYIISSGAPSAKSVTGLILLGIFQMAIPSLTFSIGIKKVRALSASFISMIEPLFNPIWVALFDGEKPGFKCILGGLIILTCLAARTIWQSKSARKKLYE